MFDAEHPFDTDWTRHNYPVAKHFLTRFREAHAVAAMFHLNEELAAKFPILNGQINEGWQAHYNSPIHVDQIMKPPNTGELAWDDEDKEWLAQTVRYYVSSMSEEQLEERGITPDKAKLLLKYQVQRALPLPLVQGFRQLTNGVLPTPLPQGTRAAADDRSKPLAPRSAAAKKSAPTPRRKVRTPPPAPPPHGPHHRRRAVCTPAAPPPHGPHPTRTPAARSAPPPCTPAARPAPTPLHPLRSARGGGGSQEKSTPGKERHVPVSDKRALDEDKVTEDDEEDVVVHKRPATKRMR